MHGGDYGADIEGPISSAGGNITITGLGGSDVNNSDYGVYLNSNITSAGAGNITINGLGGNGGGSVGLYIASTPTIGGASDTGNVILKQDTATWGFLAVQTTGNITIKEYTASTTIGVGTNATGLPLNINDTFLGALSSYNTLIIGDTSAGAVDINTGSSIANQNLTFISGGTIYLDKSGDTSPTALTDSGSSNTTLTLQAGTDIITAGAITNSGTGTLNVLMDADYALGGGAITIGGNITTLGGNITMGGGNTGITAGTLNANGTVNAAATGYAVGDAASKYGVYVNDVTVDAGGGNIIINGFRGYNNSGGSQSGVYENTGTIKTNSTGTIAISGTGSGTGSNNFGVLFLSGGITTSGTGNITVIGSGSTAGTTGDTNTGIRFVSGGYITGSGGNILINGSGGIG